MTHPKKAAMVAAIARTGNVSASARAAQIERCTHYRWMQSDPEYAALVEDAFEEAVDVLEAAARKRALLGSDTLLIFLLKCLRPARFRDRCEVKQTARVEVVQDDVDPLEVLRDPDVRDAVDNALARRAERLRLSPPAG